MERLQGLLSEGFVGFEEEGRTRILSCRDDGDNGRLMRESSADELVPLEQDRSEKAQTTRTKKAANWTMLRDGMISKVNAG